jgi:hypothetical protein
MKTFFIGDIIRMCSLGPTGITGKPRCFVVKDVDLLEDKAELYPVQYAGREYNGFWVSLQKLQSAVKIPRTLLFSEI